jgi:hypothetical protein
MQQQSLKFYIDLRMLCGSRIYSFRMVMTTPDANGYLVELVQTPGLGSPFIVRVYKKRLFFKKRISSDWFLDEKQARRYADQLRRDLGDPGTQRELRDRPPGWILRCPAP